MKLYVTPTSPFARLVCIARLEMQLADRVELVWTRTRNPDDPLLAVNPSGRIPFLLLDDGTGFEDTPVIIDYLDSLAEPRLFGVPSGADHWPFRRIEAMARSMLDGVSVWAREMVRPAAERSPTIIAHERRRAGRLADFFSAQIDDPALNGPLNSAQLHLFCTLEVERRLGDFDWRSGRPELVAWHARMSALPAVAGSLLPSVD